METRSASQPYDARSIGIAVARLALWFMGFMLIWFAGAAASAFLKPPRLGAALLSHLAGSALLMSVVWGSGWRRVLLPVSGAILGVVLPLILVAEAGGLDPALFAGAFFGGLLSLAVFPPTEWVVRLVQRAMSNAPPQASAGGSPSTRQLAATAAATCTSARFEPEPNKPSLEFRLWTASQGCKSQEAAFIGCTDGFVRVVKRDGTQGRLPLDRLCQQDRDYVERCLSAGEQDLFESI